MELLKCDVVKHERSRAAKGANPQMNRGKNLLIKTMVIMIFSNWVHMSKSNFSVGAPAQLDDGPSC